MIRPQPNNLNYVTGTVDSANNPQTPVGPNLSDDANQVNKIETT